MHQDVCVVSPYKAQGSLMSGAIPFDLNIENEYGSHECHAAVVCCSSIFLHQMYERSADKRRIVIGVDDPQDVLYHILKFLYGSDIVITDENVGLVSLYAQLLDIEPLKNPSMSCLREFTSVFNVSSSINSWLSASLEPEVQTSFVINHFDELCDRDDFMRLPLHYLKSVLTSPELKIGSEDAIAVWVSKVIERRGNKASILFDSIHFGDVTKETILELCTTDGIDAPSLIKTIKANSNDTTRRIRNTIRRKDESIDEDVLMSFPFNGYSDVDGIIAWCLNDGHSLRVNASSSKCPYFDVENILSSDSDRCWYSLSHEGQYFEMDFVEYIIRPTAYFLQTSQALEGHLRSWCLKGSNDRVVWKKLDERVGSSILKGMGKNYACSVRTGEFFRFFRVEQVGVNHRGDYSFTMSRVEFYGDVRRLRGRD